MGSYHRPSNCYRLAQPKAHCCAGFWPNTLIVMSILECLDPNQEIIFVIDKNKMKNSIKLYITKFYSCKPIQNSFVIFKTRFI